MKIYPKHVAIIMDGNGRWAERRLLPRIAGYNPGVESARKTVQYCIDANIKALTLFAFSSENWQRPATEIKLLMSLLQSLLENEVQQLHNNKVKLRVIGDVQRLAPVLQQAIANAQALTMNNTGLQLNIALNYGGRWDIVQAARNVCKEVKAGNMDISELDEETFDKYVSLGGMPPPDLLIRTSGEQRISNFLLWQLAYTELYFTTTLWPDFTLQDFNQALDFYATRQRRFGLTQPSKEIAEHV